MCLRRWAAAACADEGTRARLLADPFFLALADRLAAASDAIAAARAAEWAEQDPSLDELIIDTAPGVAGIELLARPKKLLALLQGRMVRWLRHAGRGGRVVGGLARIAGVDALDRAGDFFNLMDEGLAELARRLEHARRWLKDASVIVVTGVSGVAAGAAIDIAEAVGALDLQPRLAVLNRALPPSLHAVATEDPGARMFFRYVDNYRGLQSRVAAQLARRFPRVVALPESAAVDRDGLAALGASLFAAL